MTDLKNQLALATVNAMIKAVRRVRESGKGATLDPNLPPFANLDPERYDYVEKLVAANAHMMPSVTRFHALCNILSRGFKLAYETPVDIDLAKRNWLSACLEMMTENPLLNPHNDWKITLTIPDAQLLAAAFAKAVGNMIKWADSVRQTEPLADLDNWGGLIAVIYKTFIAGHEVFHDNEWKAELTDKALLRQNDNGNMQIDDRNIRSILAACEVHHAVASYKAIQLPPDKLTEVNCGNAGIEFDHAYVCQIIDAALRICHQDMVERITMHNGTDNLAERRAALSFTSGKNTWFDYYVKEYCAPAKWHLSKCRDPEVEEADLPTNFGILDKISQLMCQFLVNDTGGSELAMQVSEEWEDIHAIFVTRCLGKAMPSFAEQVAFCTKLSVFMEHFAKAADSIGRTPQKRETPEQTHKPTLEDIYSQLMENTSMIRKICDWESNADVNTELQKIHNELRASRAIGNDILYTVSSGQKGVEQPAKTRAGQIRRDMAVEGLELIKKAKFNTLTSTEAARQVINDRRYAKCKDGYKNNPADIDALRKQIDRLADAEGLRT